MKRPSAPDASGSAWRSARPLLFPVIALLLYVALSRGAFDVDDVRAALAEGRPDVALRALSAADAAELPRPLADVAFYTSDERAPLLARLRERPDDERPESDGPTIVAPLRSHRVPPTTLRLREALPVPVDVTFRSLEMRMDMGAVPVPAGVIEVPIPMTLLPGTRVQLLLAARDDALPPALGWFGMLSLDDARAVSTILLAARELAGDDAQGADFLAAVVALQYDLAHEALALLRPLLDEPRFADVARELTALALDRQGLDRQALAVLDGGV